MKGFEPDAVGLYTFETTKEGKISVFQKDGVYKLSGGIKDGWKVDIIKNCLFIP